ncbi:hypothetical protein NITHO_1830022 [Nitrolancea hollandica Lb]|uniref:Uncharacterized protein n=1 Tax=Nitrolancea hollandica Lb TaxID=1129897 RepID=I4EEH8_9BACT|nr:hypothetical protein NITHO_1830022 [Nitrolancea hollandica Lb]
MYRRSEREWVLPGDGLEAGGGVHSRSGPMIPPAAVPIRPEWVPARKLRFWHTGALFVRYRIGTLDSGYQPRYAVISGYPIPGNQGVVVRRCRYAPRTMNEGAEADEKLTARGAHRRRDDQYPLYLVDRFRPHDLLTGGWGFPELLPSLVPG